MTTYYSKDHEWISIENGIGTVGITEHAQQALGDVVFVEVPDIGRVVVAKEAVAVVESVKAASDIFAPAAGEIVAVNDAIVKNSALVNEGAETTAWFFKIKLASPSNFDGLMDKATYDKYCAENA